MSGPGRQLAETVDVLARMGTELRILVFARVGSATRPYQTFLKAAGISHVVVEERSSFDFNAVRQVAAELERFKPDIVQTHGYKPSAVAFALRRLGRRFRWVAFYHGSTTENLKVRAYHLLDQFLMRTADTVVVMSRLHAAALNGRGRDIRLIHNAVLFPIEPSRPASSPDASPRMLVAGRLSSEKGVDVLVDACAILLAKGHRFHLDIIGDGPDRASLERQAQRLALTPLVTFHGHQSDPRPFYRAADLLVIPSRSEGLPNVLLEAIAHGLPIVSTRVGAVPEVLIDVAVGVLCDVGDVEGLSAAMMHASSPAYREQGHSGRQRVLEDFSLHRRCERLSALYAFVLENSSRNSHEADYEN
ncbi:glycosyltransferase [Gemmatimonas sp.]|uniref:glycosyltransferase n=1 Tax=Gemmatimonas sp. TaxID=1962908 RepID=UPI00286E6724|nr:glycosyltransferase [Gemmatimonas sp.]